MPAAQYPRKPLFVHPPSPPEVTATALCISHSLPSSVCISKAIAELSGEVAGTWLGNSVGEVSSELWEIVPHSWGVFRAAAAPAAGAWKEYSQEEWAASCFCFSVHPDSHRAPEVGKSRCSRWRTGTSLLHD